MPKQDGFDAAGVPIPRRAFLQQSLGLLGSITLATTFESFSKQIAAGGSPFIPGHGPLRPTKDETTSLELLQLPEGFRYLSYGWTGDEMDGGVVTPGQHDGMGVIASDESTLTLCRNHELKSWDKPFGSDAIRYDAKAGGGCSNLRFDIIAERWVKAWPSLAGTVRNCAGGPTPWGTWLSCEETILGPGDEARGYEKTHGWIFEVGVDGARPIPLKDMGRFVHEAVAVDPATGYVYETEDRSTAGFYRFVPNKRGKLSSGGKLQMLKAAGAPSLRWGSRLGQVYDVSWVDIEEPERVRTPGILWFLDDNQGVFSQGKALGATTFARLEGCWSGNRLIYFISTNGGEKKLGQVWQYDPHNEQLKLIFESPSSSVLDRPDTVAVSPRGGLVLCEDGHGVPERMHGMTPDGRIFPLAANNIVLNGERHGLHGDYRGKEWCGPTFSPDGRWLFVNIQTPGITFAITGPWGEGPL